jgi:hypothetical protein
MGGLSGISPVLFARMRGAKRERGRVGSNKKNQKILKKILDNFGEVVIIRQV